MSELEKTSKRNICDNDLKRIDATLAHCRAKYNEELSTKECLPEKISLFCEKLNNAINSDDDFESIIDQGFKEILEEHRLIIDISRLKLSLKDLHNNKALSEMTILAALHNLRPK